MVLITSNWRQKLQNLPLQAELIDGGKWLDDSKAIIERPKVKEAKWVNEAFEQFDRGSSFTVRLGGEIHAPKTYAG